MSYAEPISNGATDYADRRTAWPHKRSRGRASARRTPNVGSDERIVVNEHADSLDLVLRRLRETDQHIAPIAVLRLQLVDPEPEPIRIRMPIEHGSVEALDEMGMI